MLAFSWFRGILYFYVMLYFWWTCRRYLFIGSNRVIFRNHTDATSLLRRRSEFVTQLELTTSAQEAMMLLDLFEFLLFFSISVWALRGCTKFRPRTKIEFQRFCILQPFSCDVSTLRSVHVGWYFMEWVPPGLTAFIMYRYLVAVRSAEEVPPHVSLQVDTYAQYWHSFNSSHMQSDVHTSDRTSRPQHRVW